MIYTPLGPSIYHLTTWSCVLSVLQTMLLTRSSPQPETSQTKLRLRCRRRRRIYTRLHVITSMVPRSLIMNAAISFCNRIHFCYHKQYHPWRHCFCLLSHLSRCCYRLRSSCTHTYHFFFLSLTAAISFCLLNCMHVSGHDSTFDVNTKFIHTDVEYMHEENRPATAS